MYDFTGDSATIYTGTGDVSKSGTIENYNRRPYLPQWPAAPCNKVSGASDGTKFPSASENGTQMMFFRKSLCRAIPMVRVTTKVQTTRSVWSPGAAKVIIIFLRYKSFDETRFAGFKKSRIVQAEKLNVHHKKDENFDNIIFSMFYFFYNAVISSSELWLGF